MLKFHCHWSRGGPWLATSTPLISLNHCIATIHQEELSVAEDWIISRGELLSIICRDTRACLELIMQIDEFNPVNIYSWYPDVKVMQ